MVDVRYGSEFSDDDLRPDDYETPGGPVRSRLLRGGGVLQVNELAAVYSVDGIPYAHYKIPMQDDGKRYTKIGAEVFGAVRAFIYAGERDVTLSTGFTEPHPDLAVKVGGMDACLEVTQVRPDGAFEAGLRELTEIFRVRRSEDVRLATITESRRISLGFVALPRSREIPSLISTIIEWLVGVHWSQGDPPVPPEADFARFVRAVRAFPADAERPISAAWLLGATPGLNFPDLIADCVEVKKAKHYSGSPLWLAVTAATAFDALRAVARSRIDPGQFDRIYITDAQDGILIRRLDR